MYDHLYDLFGHENTPAAVLNPHHHALNDLNIGDWIISKLTGSGNNRF